MGFKYTTPDWSSSAWAGDKFLGTGQIQYNNQLGLMNEANRFSEYMSNTAYQRSVADMVAAGINPTIAFANGARAASSPQGASGSAVAPGRGIVTGMLDNTLNKVFEFVSAKAANAVIGSLLKFAF